MVGTTLVEIREHIETLATDDGEYRIICGRTGDRPVPVVGSRFDNREIARSAARAAKQYRRTLRKYDPQVPQYDLIVCQDTEPITRCQQQPDHLERPHQQTLSTPVLQNSESVSQRRDRVEFCHRATGAVFETLSEMGYGDIEQAIMNMYFDLTETVSDPDKLCLCLLRSMAVEIDTQLDPTDQLDILTGAATRLESTDKTKKPLITTFETLRTNALISGFTHSPWSIAREDGLCVIVIRMSGYALSALDDRLPVLPIVLEFYRHDSIHRPVSLRAIDHDTSWQIQFTLANWDVSTGLVCAPIDSEA